MNRLIIYSKKGCPFCSLLKSELANRSIPFIEMDVSDDDVRASFYENSGTKTVPQVYVTNVHVTETEPAGQALGGWSEVSKLLGTLTNFLA